MREIDLQRTAEKYIFISTTTMYLLPHRNGSPPSLRWKNILPATSLLGRFVGRVIKKYLMSVLSALVHKNFGILTGITAFDIKRTMQKNYGFRICEPSSIF